MEHFNETYNNLKVLITEDIIMTNISNIVLKVIQLTEKIPEDGPTKKKVAISIINRLIIDTEMDDKNNKDDLLGIVDTIVPQMIDCLVDIDKRKLVIKTTKKTRTCMEFICF